MTYMVDTDRFNSPFSEIGRHRLKKVAAEALSCGSLTDDESKLLIKSCCPRINEEQLNFVISMLEKFQQETSFRTNENIAELLDCGHQFSLRLRAQNKCPEAMYEYGHALIEGKFGLTQNPKKGARMILKSANAGFADAQYAMHFFYYRGLHGVQENDHQALEMLSKAAKNEHCEALRRLGDWHYFGIVVDQSYKIAHQLYASSAHAGSVEAKVDLAICYFEGLGVDADQCQAFEILRSVASDECVRAMRVLGQFYSTPGSAETSMTKALQWWTKGAESGDANCATQIGRSYWHGIGVPECNQKAYEWFLKAVSLSGEGSKTAQYHLGLCQYLGLGCEEDEYAAYANFTDAAEFGVGAAGYYIGLCKLNGQGTDVDQCGAFEYFSQTAHEMPGAAFLAGECLRKGEGTDIDLARAFEFYLISAKSDNADAQTAIGRAFYLGEGVPEDDEEAVKWFQLAVKKENARAQYYLGGCYLQGYGVEEDHGLAHILLRRSASQGHDGAMKMLRDFNVPLQENSEENCYSENVVTLGNKLVTNSRLIYSNILSQDDCSSCDTAGADVIMLSQWQ